MTSTATVDEFLSVSAPSLVKPHREKGRKRAFGSDFDFDTATHSGRGMRTKVPSLRIPKNEPTDNKQMVKAQLKMAEQVRILLG